MLEHYSKTRGQPSPQRSRAITADISAFADTQRTARGKESRRRLASARSLEDFQVLRRRNIAALRIRIAARPPLGYCGRSASRADRLSATAAWTSPSSVCRPVAPRRAATARRGESGTGEAHRRAQRAGAGQAARAARRGVTPRWCCGGISTNHAMASCRAAIPLQLKIVVRLTSEAHV